MGEGGEEVNGERDRESDRRFRVEEGLIIIPQVVLLNQCLCACSRKMLFRVSINHFIR